MKKSDYILQKHRPSALTRRNATDIGFDQLENLTSTKKCTWKIPLFIHWRRSRFFWEVFIIVTTMWVSIAQPFNMTFLQRLRQSSDSDQLQSFLLINSISIDIIFFLDIVVNFRTTFEDKNTGETILNSKEIIRHYILHGSFFIDLLASIPWFIIEDLISQKYSRTTRMLRLLRLFRITKLLTKVKSKRTLKYSIKFLQLLVAILLLCHWGACVWYEVIMIDQAWRPGRDYFYGKNIYQDSIWIQYSLCMYYSVILLTQGGQIWPRTHKETIAAIVFQLVGLLITTILYSNMLLFVDLYMNSHDLLNQYLDTTEEICDNLHIPPKLRRKCLNFVQKYIKQMNIQEEWGEFMAILPESIKSTVSNQIFTRMLISAPAKIYMHDYQFRRVISKLDPCSLIAQQIVFSVGERAEKLYVICNGQIEIYIQSLSISGRPMQKYTDTIQVVGQGEFLGFAGMFTKTRKYTYSARCLKTSVLVGMEYLDFKQIFLKNQLLHKSTIESVMNRHQIHQKITQDFRKSIPYLQGIKSALQIFHLSTAIQRKFVDRKTCLIPRGGILQHILYIQEGSATISVRNKQYPTNRGKTKIIFDTLKTGSIYGIFSILNQKVHRFIVDVKKNSLIQLLHRQDLQRLSKQIQSISKAPLLYQDTLQPDYISVQKQIINPLQIEETSNRSLSMTISFLSNYQYIPKPLSANHKLKKVVLKILQINSPLHESPTDTPSAQQDSEILNLMNKLLLNQDQTLALANSLNFQQMERASNKSTRFSVDPKISQQRYLQLKGAFDQIDTDGSGMLSFEQIFNFFKSISQDVSQQYVQDIYQSMDVNRDGVVNVQEFIQGYLRQVNALSDQVAKLKQMLNENKKEKNRLLSELEQAKKIEKINPWGIMEGSTLKVTADSAENLSGLAGPPSAYVTLHCEKQTISTKVVKSDKNPNWDQTFTFKVTMEKSKLEVKIYNKGSVSKDDLLGACEVPLEEFKDQYQHQRWFSLSGRAHSARILLSIQWIHRKTWYLAREIDQIEREMFEQETVKSQKQEELRKLGTNTLGTFSRDNWYLRIEGKIIDQVKEFNELYLNRFSAFRRIQQILLLVLCLLAVLTSFERTDFFNVSWVCFMISKEITKFSMRDWRIGFASLLLLIFSDFVWVADDFEFLVFEINEDPHLTLKRFAFIVGFLNFLLKIILFMCVVKNFADAKHNENQALLRKQVKFNIEMSLKDLNEKV